MNKISLGDFMNNIKNNILEKELFYDNTLILKYHIEYPTISSSSMNPCIFKFNMYNKNIAFSLRKKAENELYEEAIELYKYNKENNFPVMQYEVYRNYEITLNTNNFISLYSDEYIFTGGAHGTTVRTSQTWNLMQCNIIELNSLFPKNPYFMIDILKQINAQIAKEPEIYFDNTCNLVLETFNPNSFYITPNEIVIYFQQYDIAPYSSGIRTFNIKYSN